MGAQPDVTICVATFGATWWQDLAARRAIPSALEQGVPVINMHGPTLAAARNEAAARASSKWLIFLDADDELAPGYAGALAGDQVDGGDLRAPRLVEVAPDGSSRTIPTARRHIELVNPCCIGTAIRADMFAVLGGFTELEAWEDWHLWLRAHRAGATITHHHDAVYRAHWRADSMNRTVADPQALHTKIKAML